jgi:hypothetical protein
MPRDITGDYTLPLPPVADGTVIDDQWANPTMADIAATITASLDRNGRGGMNVPVLNQDGAVSAPGIAWGSEPQSGFYRAGLNDMRAAVDGADVVQFIDDSAAPAGNQRPFRIWTGTEFASPLRGTPDESPTFGSLTFEASGNPSGMLLINDTLDIAGNFSAGLFFMGSMGYAWGNGFAGDISGFNVEGTVGGGAGEYHLSFDRDLLGYPNPIVVTAGYKTTIGPVENFPTWEVGATPDELVVFGTPNQDWFVMAVLEDA